MRSRATSWPRTCATPRPIGRSVVRMRIVVVLPAPLGPSSPNISPCWTSRSTPSTARCSPNANTRSSQRTAGVASITRPAPACRGAARGGEPTRAAPRRRRGRARRARRRAAGRARRGSAGGGSGRPPGAPGGGGGRGAAVAGGGAALEQPVPDEVADERADRVRRQVQRGGGLADADPGLGLDNAEQLDLGAGQRLPADHLAGAAAQPAPHAAPRGGEVGGQSLLEGGGHPRAECTSATELSPVTGRGRSVDRRRARRTRACAPLRRAARARARAGSGRRS